MTRSKKPTQRRRASKSSPVPRDVVTDQPMSLWEPYCITETVTAVAFLTATAQEALDENERAYWAGVSELGLAHEAEIALAIS